MSHTRTSSESNLHALLFVLVSGSSSLFRVIKDVNSAPQFFVYRIFNTEIDSKEKRGVNKIKGTIKRGDKVKNEKKLIKKINKVPR